MAAGSGVVTSGVDCWNDFGLLLKPWCGLEQAVDSVADGADRAAGLNDRVVPVLVGLKHVNRYADPVLVDVPIKGDSTPVSPVAGTNVVAFEH